MAIPENEGPKTPEWIVTFTDLMSLLLCFFVLLLTFSTPKVEKLFELRGSIQGSFGVFSGQPDDRDTWIPPNPSRQGRDMNNPLSPALMPRFRPLEDNEPNRNLQKLKDQSGEEIEWDRLFSGYEVRLSDAVDYDVGELDMSADSFARLAKVAKAVEFTPFSFVFVGSVGRNEVEAFRLQGLNPMEAAVERAMRVAKRMVEAHGVNRDNIAIAAFGPTSSGPEVGQVDFVLAKNEQISGTE
jgi:chemotaxis protein MotB